MTTTFVLDTNVSPLGNRRNTRNGATRCRQCQKELGPLNRTGVCPRYKGNRCYDLEFPDAARNKRKRQGLRREPRLGRDAFSERTAIMWTAKEIREIDALVESTGIERSTLIRRLTAIGISTMTKIDIERPIENEIEQARPAEVPIDVPAPTGAEVIERAPDDLPYKVICISLYNSDLDRLKAMVAELKRRGMRKASASWLIRLALSKLDLDEIAKP